MKRSKLEWNPVTPRPDVAGHFLIWSKDRGVRHTTYHPDWWNGQDTYLIGKVEAYAYLGPMTIANDAKRVKVRRTTLRR